MRVAWVVRAGQGAIAARQFLDQQVVALGGSELGDLSNCRSLEEVRVLYARVFPADSQFTRNVRASQIARFVLEMHVGDAVVTPGPHGTAYLVGAISSGYEWRPRTIPEFPHVRQVRWTSVAARRSLTQRTLNSLGSISALFSISDEMVTELLRNGKSVEDAPTDVLVPGSASR